MGKFAHSGYKGKWKKPRKARKAKAGACRRVRVCGKSRIICRDRKGRIKSNRPAGKRRK